MFSSIIRFAAAPILPIALIIGSLVSATEAQQTPSQQVDKASLNTIAAELKDKFGNVRFHRDETLEDRFISHGLQPLSFGRLPLFFQIQQPQFNASGRFVTENTANTLPTMYVASSSDGAKIYRLYGFSNSEEEFNRLVADSPSQKIITNADAEIRGLLCAEIVYGLASQWWVADPSNAKLQAAEHFFSAGRKDGLLRGEKWWESIKGDRAAVTIKTAKNESDGFFITLPIFWAPVEGDAIPQIKIFRIEISESGSCHMEKQPIFVLK